jgi:hypothetical protein
VSGDAARIALDSLPARWPASVTIARGDAPAHPLPFALPAMVKAEAGLAHRRDAGGVLGPLSTPEQIDLAVRLLQAEFGSDVEIVEYVPHTTEYYAGIQRLDDSSTVLAFGRSRRGDRQDASVMLCPATDRELGEVVGRYVTIGHDRDPLVAVLSELQEVAGRGRMRSVDLNPIVVPSIAPGSPLVAVVLDAKLLLDEKP